MKPESSSYLAKAREDLGEARQIAAIGLAKAAARAAYYAAFHAAEALILERTGKVAKSHSGVRSEFARIVRPDADSGKAMTAFLAQTYKYKEIGDYGIGASAVVTIIDADAAIRSAEGFVDYVERMLR